MGRALKKTLNLKSRSADLDSFGRTRDSSTESGDDVLVVGTTGADLMTGTSASETFESGEGHDTINGGGGNDVIDGGKEGDQLNGGDDNDIIDGGSGYDTLQGNDGNDLLVGGSYPDTLNGNAGNDTLTGGSGSDQFILSRGRDVITDLDKKDRIVIDQELIGIPGQDGPFLKESRKRGREGEILFRTKKGIRTRIEASGLSIEEVSNLIEIRMSDPEQITAKDGEKEEFQLTIGEVKEIDNFNFDEGDRLLLPDNRVEVERATIHCGEEREWWPAPHYRLIHENNSSTVLIQYSAEINTQRRPERPKDYYDLAKIELDELYDFSGVDRGLGSIFKDIAESLSQDWTTQIIWLQKNDDEMWDYGNSAGSNYFYVLGEEVASGDYNDLSPWFHQDNNILATVTTFTSFNMNGQFDQSSGGGITYISHQANDYLDGRNREDKSQRCSSSVNRIPGNTWRMYSGDNQAIKSLFLGDGDDFVYLASYGQYDYGDNIIHGQQGSDSLFGGNAADVIYGGDGDDILSGIGLKLTNDRPDALTEQTSEIEIMDPIETKYEPFTISQVNQDNDLLLGGAGNDTLYATTGSDTLDGGDGNDLLVAIEPATSLGHSFNLSRGTDLIDLSSIKLNNISFFAPKGWTSVLTSAADDVQLPEEFSSNAASWESAEKNIVIELTDREGMTHTTYLMSQPGDIEIEEGDYEDGYEPDTIIIEEPTANPEWDLTPEEQKWINRCTLDVNGVFELGPKDDVLTTNMQIQADGLDGKGGMDTLILTNDYQCGDDQKMGEATSMVIQNFERIEQQGGNWALEGEHQNTDLIIKGGEVFIRPLKRLTPSLDVQSLEISGGTLRVDLSEMPSQEGAYPLIRSGSSVQVLQPFEDIQLQAGGDSYAYEDSPISIGGDSVSLNQVGNQLFLQIAST